MGNITFVLIPFLLFAQISEKGTPFSFTNLSLGTEYQSVNLPKPLLKELLSEDSVNDKNGSPFRFASNIPVDLNLENSGTWEVIEKGNRIWRMKVSCKGALALSCYFNFFSLPEGGRLFIYPEDRSYFIGAFTSKNNQENGSFATELIPGESLILEYFEPATAIGHSHISVSEVAYAYRGISAPSKNKRGFGSSGPCEVNVNCNEGNNWQSEIRGVLRIQVKIGPSSYWCTGSLLNNVRQDYTPYILTADHCGIAATPTDLSQWIFYFNYESDDCQDPILEPNFKSLTGARKKAATGGGGTVTASDFYLVKLLYQVPLTFNPYFNGWSRTDLPSLSGVGIHHPQGDIKKISTYTSSAYSTTWSSIPNTHWGVKWSATQNGHGVTEGGSSGSPLFNEQGLIIGQLSGGGSSCAALNEGDLYGKINYSWQPNGSDSTNSLKHWLDPDNSGVWTLAGLNTNLTFVSANFTCDQDTIIVGNSINYTDLSTGDPVGWNWNFNGGTPNSSTLKTPESILYEKPGVFSVSLIAKNNSTSDTIERKRFITVIPNIYPNPFTDFVNIDLGEKSTGAFSIVVYNTFGQIVKYSIIEIDKDHHYRVNIYDNIPGLYYLKFSSDTLKLSKKIILMKKKG